MSSLIQPYYSSSRTTELAKFEYEADNLYLRGYYLVGLDMSPCMYVLHQEDTNSTRDAITIQMPKDTFIVFGKVFGHRQNMMPQEPCFMDPIATGLRLMTCRRPPQTGAAPEYCLRLEADFMVTNDEETSIAEPRSIVFPMSHAVVMLVQCVKALDILEQPIQNPTELPVMHYVALRTEGTNTPWDFFLTAASAQENIDRLTLVQEDAPLVPMEEHNVIRHGRGSPVLMDFMDMLDDDAARQLNTLSVSSEWRLQHQQLVDSFVRTRPQVALTCAYMVYRAYKDAILHFGERPFTRQQVHEAENFLLYNRPTLQRLFNETLEAADYAMNLITHDGITALILMRGEDSPRGQALTALECITVRDLPSIIAERGLAALYNHRVRNYMRLDNH